MFYTVNVNEKRAIVVSSIHNRSKRRPKSLSEVSRSQSEFNTKSYSDSLQRAFNRVKQQIYFNPDMTEFITLTYRGADHTPQQVLSDVKEMVRKERRNLLKKGDKRDLKYVYIMEYQKRGSIHVHMISNSLFTLRVNRNGYAELTNWPHGFSSCLTIKDFDKNFKPYLYLFKYMRKAERIGSSFVHSSRNLDNFEEIDYHEFNKRLWRESFAEETIANLPDGTTRTFYRRFYEFKRNSSGSRGPIKKDR